VRILTVILKAAMASPIVQTHEIAVYGWVLAANECVNNHKDY
jgi:hypothetical protein